MNLQDIREIVRKDPETKNLTIRDVDLMLVYQYLTARDKNEIRDGYRPHLRTDPYLEIVYRPTTEKAEELRKNRIRQHLKFFDSEIYIQDASLAAFRTFNEERQHAYNAAANFLENYAPNNYEKGLYIYGKYATGKSYLLSAIAHQLAERNITVLFVYTPDLVRSIKQGMNEGNLEQRVNELKQAQVLMLDDLGGENMSTWFRDEILTPIIQYRLSAKLPVFISSNLELVQLLETLTVDKDDANRTKAARLIQRIKDLCIYVKLSKDQYTGQ